MTKNKVFRLLFLIVVADILYDDGGAYLYKRIFFSILIYLSIFDIFIFYKSLIMSKSSIKMSFFSNIYICFFIIFIFINLITDFINPDLNLITLINNPYALLTVMPVFIFFIGVNTQNLKQVLDLLLLVCLSFLIVWFVKLPGSIPYYEGYVTSDAIIPFFIFSRFYKKYRHLALILLILTIPFSLISDQRIILLKVLAFSGLFVSLNLVKRFNILKFVIIILGCGMIYLMLYNLELILDLFKSSVGGNKFDSNDTRSFLYQELFDDLKKSELIFGRGFLGTYFSNYFLMLMENLDDTGDFYQRFSVEVGFLELVLKGGFVYYFLFTIPLWYVSIRSIFRYSHRKIPFYIGIYLLTELLLMFFGHTPYFGFQYSLLFFLAGYAYRIMYTINLPTSNVYTDTKLSLLSRPS